MIKIQHIMPNLILAWWNSQEKDNKKKLKPLVYTWYYFITLFVSHKLRTTYQDLASRTDCICRLNVCKRRSDNRWEEIGYILAVFLFRSRSIFLCSFCGTRTIPRLKRISTCRICLVAKIHILCVTLTLENLCNK